MNNSFKYLLVFTLVLSICQLAAQDLDDFFKDIEETHSPELVTFMGERIISGPTTETLSKGELNMIIGHRFGRIDGGLYEFFGLDQATMRMGFDYGITDRFMVGIGRSSFQKIFDFHLKYKALEQAAGKSPLSISLFSSFNYINLRNYFPESNNSFNDKGGVSILVPVSRRFGEILAVQLTPAWHRSNFVPVLNDKADILALGAGLRVKLTKRIHLTGEYFHLTSTPYTDHRNPLSIGFDIDTGGHLFQLLFSNSRGMTEKIYLSDTMNSWANGEIIFGFNLIRTFYLKN